MGLPGQEERRKESLERGKNVVETSKQAPSITGLVSCVSLL